MNKTYIKIIIQEIKHSLGRFAAIFGIVALSVGFLSGLMATTPDMKSTADEYFDKNNMADIFIKGTKGLTNKDLDVVKNFSGTKDLITANVTDALLETGTGEILTTRIYGIDLLNNEDNINKLSLISGRMPENEYECVAEKSLGHITEINIGEKLLVSTQNEDYENIDDIYAVKEFTVVGIVSNPFYFSIEIERSNIGNGRIGSIIYVDEKSYSMDVYTDFYLTFEDAKNQTALTDEYENYIDENVKLLKDIGKTQSVLRDEEIKDEAYEKLNDAKKEYNEAKLDAEKELSDAAKEIEDGKIELSDAAKDIEEAKIELSDAKITLKREIQDAEQEISDGYIELADAKVELEDGEKEYIDGLIELADGKKEYEEGLIEFQDAQKELQDAQNEFDEGEQEFLAGVKKYEDGRSELRQGQRELKAAREHLTQAEIEYEAGVTELNTQKAQFNGLTGQIIMMSHLPFSSTEELMIAIENDVYITTSTSIKGTVTGVLNAMSSMGYPVPKDADELLFNYLKLKAGEETLEIARQQIAAGWLQYEEGIKELEKGRNKLSKAKSEIDKGRKELEDNRIKLQDGWNELEDARIELQDAKKEIEDGEKELQDARIELDDGWKEYYDGIEEIKDAEITLKVETDKANKEIRDGEIKLYDGILEYEDGLKELLEGEEEYLTAKADAEIELNNAAAKISDAEKEIAELDMPKWYVLDRNSNVSYLSFAVNVEKVADIAGVFPIFFFLIAALVTLTTMTRMVEEERTQIGTLKALGYKKSAIISKYLIYCGLASILGSVAGLLFGFRLLPKVIYNAYRSMYYLPDLSSQFLWEYALPVSLFSILSTVLVTAYVSIKTLEEKPSTLMLPRAPKPGKRIFLERITFIWDRMKFTHKSTARNILRYKRHFYMTVTGIAGCTALMLTGFGLLDSIGKIANTQFEDIFKYNFTIQLNDEEKDSILNDFLESEVYAETMTDTVYIDHEGDELAATVIIPKNHDSIKDVISLRERTTKSLINFNSSSVIMTEKLAETMKLNVGDKFIIKNEDDVEAEFILTDITENYVGIYLYINSSDYFNAFNEEIKYNTIMVANIDEENMDNVIEKLLSGSVMSAEPLSQLKKSFDSLLTNIKFIVTVIVFSSGSLAFIVLYNLTNININERRKELSALKVLGYHREEIAAYVFRESFILSILGTIAGLFLGVLLHSFVIKSVEASNLMLGRNISTLSYILSAVLTLIFSLIVNLFMKRKLRKIEMVESMKAIE